MNSSKKILLLPFFPILAIELVVLKRSLDNYFSSKVFSPSQQIALGTESQMILGTKTDIFSEVIIERMLIGVIVFLIILIGILISKGREKRFESGKSF